MISRTTVFTRLVRDHMSPPPVIVDPDTTCQELVRLMREQEASSAIAADGTGRVTGIVTEQDVVRRITYMRTPEVPIRKIMNSPVHTIRESDYLYHGLARMRAGGLCHMPVISDRGRVVGILQQHLALAAASGEMMDLIERLTRKDSVLGMKRTKDAQVQLAENLFEDNVPAPEVQGLLTHINNDLYARLVALALEEMETDGWGAPPVAFEVIVMGSGGRGESFLEPDQDNGFILQDYPNREHRRIDVWFIELAERLTEALDETGFPYCKGHVMATNPLWRKSLAQWKRQTELWVQKASGPLLRLCDIFFDFTPVYGDGRMAAELRSHIAASARDRIFLHRLFMSGDEQGVPLGLLSRLHKDRSPGPNRGKINLKQSGILPLVGAMRVLALREGITDTSTLARIEALHDLGRLSADDHDYLVQSFKLITALLLNEQLEAFRAGQTIGKHISPKNLTKRQKEQLRDSFKRIRSLRLKTRLELAASVS